MLRQPIFSFGVVLTTLFLVGDLARTQTPTLGGYKAPPGVYRTSWVGNTFGGSGGPNGFGYWVQDGVAKLAVSPDGTAFCGVDWDEAGRCVGLYKEGQVNRVLLKGAGKETAWGWNTANRALAVWKDTIYIANEGKQLLRFRWHPGDINSAVFVDETALPAKAVAVAANRRWIVVAYPDAIELRSAQNRRVVRRFPLQGVKDVALTTDDSLWVLAGKNVQRLSVTGQALPGIISHLQDPTAVAISNRNPHQLLVCDNGPRQQILFYDLKPTPRLVKVFGAYSGLMSGQPGEVKPNKLFGLRGANTDAAGNLYVAMSFGNGPNGHCLLRCFAPNGVLKWQVMNLSFVDTFGFDPDSDGSLVFSRDAIFRLDLNKPKPGSEWSLKAFSVPYPQEQHSDRLRYGQSAIVRDLQGRRVLYLIGQYAGGFQIYAFRGNIAYLVGKIGRNDSWAWYVDSHGDIWNGDGPNRSLLCYRFLGWNSQGKPRYDWKNPEVWPWPNDFELVRRVIYNADTDTLYLFGYLRGETIDSWGVIGHTARCYDGWRSGSRKIRWTVSMPVNPHGNDQGQPLTPQAVDVAGDYLFVGMVKPEDNRQYTHIFRVSDGSYVGSLYPGPEVGENAGWQDMPYAVQAYRRKNGEYLVLVEEDWRGKNLLYRWWPNGRQQSANAH
ncbi:hypothetical protein CTKA_01156 [Chthonomonas calidirosea]|uniref:Uncharacterized protein n=1 Tax=Chthonomonas calidirosea (strain DSM 23976 / ICMP 18418 / T49) TaxID=1303518 RepID=S0EYG5_CHTCT|nr:hypothetical protein [Chthonomonas calidirosea]CCW36716.1 hypothetical protein CCALI_02931 [Chthonomonas calidirosea T49]CEK16503.1 hypothetical protein CTKA_01156 [Chthonomonas calidirosea]